MKHKTPKNKIHYKEYKNLFETVKCKPKYISKQNMNFKHDIKKKRDHWEKKNHKQLPPRKTYCQRKNYSSQKVKVNEFNNIFVKIGPKRAKKIEPSKCLGYLS